MGLNVTDPGYGGVDRAGIWSFLQRCVLSHPVIRVRDVCPDAPYGLDPGGISQQGGSLSDGEIDAATATGGDSCRPWRRLFRRRVWILSIPT